jgi:hypothetical protein
MTIQYLACIGVFILLIALEDSLKVSSCIALWPIMDRLFIELYQYYRMYCRINVYLMVSICHLLQAFVFAIFKTFDLLNIGCVLGRFAVILIIALAIALRVSYDFTRQTTLWCRTRSLTLC